MGERLSGSLVRLVREIDIIILGIGILMFVTGETGPFFSKKLFEYRQFVIIDVIFFASIYIFLTYDWIAYNALMATHHYEATFRGLIRLYIDLIQLLMKAFLVIVAALEITMWHLFLTAVFFIVWHSMVLIWHLVGGINKKVLEHLIVTIVYLICAYFIYTTYLSDAGEADDWTRYGWTVGLCAIMVFFSFWRQRHFLGDDGTDARTPLSPELEAQVENLRAALTVSIAEHTRNDALLRDAQRTMAALHEKLATRPVEP